MIRATAAAIAASEPFNPLSFGSPVHAFWAEDPDWTAPADAAEVLSWRNAGSMGTAATGVTTEVPTFDADGIGGRPALAFNGTDEWLSLTGAIYSQPVTLVIVGQTTQTADRAIVDGSGGVADILIRSSTGSFVVFAGVPGAGSLGSWTSGQPFVIAAMVDGASSSFASDGGTATAFSTGTRALNGLTIGNNSDETSPFDGLIAYLAVHSGDVTGDAGWGDYIDGLMTLYGIT